MKEKKFIVSTEGINDYGFRVLNSALINVKEFLKNNPVMLFNHQRRGDSYKGPIGLWEDLELINDEWIGLPKYDSNDDFAVGIKSKVDGGFLRGASIGIEIIETTTDPKYMLAGQMMPTVTKAKLIEISICDLPSNECALALYNSKGEAIELTKDSVLKYLSISNIHKPNPPKMELKLKAKTIQTLSLGDAPTVEQIDDAVESLNKAKLAAEKKYADLVAEQKVIADKRKKKLLDTALAAGKFKADERPTFETLDYDVLKLTLEKIPGVTLPGNAINNGAGKKTEVANDRADWTLNKWMKSDYKGLMELKANDADAYAEIVKRK